MTIYGFLIAWSIFVILIYKHISQSYRYEVVLGRDYKRCVPFFAIIAVLPLFFTTAFRTNVGDTGLYKIGFLDIKTSSESVKEYLFSEGKDKGFVILQVLLKYLIGDNEDLFLIIIAAIQILLVFYMYRKYSPDFAISLFLFIASTDYISWLFNGMRQFFAVSLICACFGWIVQRKNIPVIIMVLLAATMHGSALLMLPILFIVQGKAFNKNIVLFLVVTIILIPFIGNLTPIIEDLLANTQYDNMMTNELWLNDDGTSLIRTFVYSVPAIVAFLARKWIYKENDPILNLSVNMSVVSAGLYLISSFSSGIYIGRLPIYASLYSYISLPWVIRCCFNKNTSDLMLTFMVIAYCVFYYYQMCIGWDFKLF